MLTPFWKTVQIKLKSVLQSRPTDMILLNFLRPSSALKKQIGDAWFSLPRKQQVELPGDPETASETRPYPLPRKPGEQIVSAPAAFLFHLTDFQRQCPAHVVSLQLATKQVMGVNHETSSRLHSQESRGQCDQPEEPSCFLSFNSALPKWGIQRPGNRGDKPVFATQCRVLTPFYC